MRLLRRKRWLTPAESEPEPPAVHDGPIHDAETGEPVTREVGEPDPAKVTVAKDPVTGKWVSLKGM
jgi:hypothetical protein